MLALRFGKDEFAFVYSAGRPIGAILVGDFKGKGRFSLLFSGEHADFEVLRPRAVEQRFGRDELDRLCAEFFSAESESVGAGCVERAGM
jgi:hypothetical protein